MPAKRILSAALALLLVAAIPARATSFPEIYVVDTIWAGANSSDALMNSVRFGNYLYFSATDNSSGWELWRTNGDTTERVKDINLTGDSYPGGFVAFGNHLYFVADDGVNGDEIWRTDGTASGTTLLKDIWNESSQPGRPALSAFGGYLYFAADDGTGDGIELWRTDGTANGTALFKEINVESAEPASSNPFDFLVAGNYLYFKADDGDHGVELWRTDGTVGGTILVKDINVGGGHASLSPLAAFGSYVYFAATEDATGSELWRSNGIESGTTLVKNINLGSAGASDSSPSSFTVFNNYLYFVADNGVTGQELWRTNGTITTPVADINSTGSSAPYSFGAFGDWLYFAADDGLSGYELWRTNGTAAGTTLAQEINTGSGGLDSSSPDLFTALGDYLYFRANDNGVGKLWRISGQGEIESTVLPGTNSFIGCQCDRAISVLNGRLFMVLYSDETGSEFAYLNEPTFVLPGTNRDGSAWSTTLVLLAAVTAVAGIGLRMPEAKRR
jgi:ELWxxDGT repeat protein